MRLRPSSLGFGVGRPHCEPCQTNSVHPSTRLGRSQITLASPTVSPLTTSAAGPLTLAAFLTHYRSHSLTWHAANSNPPFLPFRHGSSPVQYPAQTPHCSRARPYNEFYSTRHYPHFCSAFESCTSRTTTNIFGFLTSTDQRPRPNYPRPANDSCKETSHISGLMRSNTSLRGLCVRHRLLNRDIQAPLTGPEGVNVG